MIRSNEKYPKIDVELSEFDLYGEYLDNQIDRIIYGLLPQFKPLIIQDEEARNTFISLLKKIEDEVKFNIFEFTIPKLKKEALDALINQETFTLAFLKTVLDYLSFN